MPRFSREDTVFEPSPCEHGRPTTLTGLKTPVTVGHDPQEHLYVNSEHHPNSFRGVFCFTMPQHILAPNAKCWGDLDESNPNYMIHNTALSFFLYAIHSLARDDACTPRVFVEAVVHNPGTLPHSGAQLPCVDKTYLAKQIFPTNNMAGYRIWVCLPHNAPPPETIMRRAIFRIQQHLMPEEELCEMFTAKIMLCAEVEDAQRRSSDVLNALQKKLDANSAKKQKKGKKPRGKRAKAHPDGGAAEAVESDDEDGDAEMAAAPPALNPDSLMEQFRFPPSSEMRTRMNKNQPRHACNHYLRVNMLNHYIRRVLAHHHILTGLQLPDNNLYDAAPLIEGEFGEAADLREAHRMRLGAQEVFSLASSNAMFATTSARGAAAVAQTLLKSYGLTDDMQSGELTFPYPHLVWEVGTHQLQPCMLMPSRFPWVATRFMDEANRLIMEAGRQEAARRAKAKSVTAVMPQRANGDRYAALMFSEFTTNAHPELTEAQQKEANAYRSMVATNDDGISDDPEVYNDPERERAIIEQNNLLGDAQRNIVDQVDIALAGGGSQSEVLTTIAAPTNQLMKDYRYMLLRAMDAINRMHPPTDLEISASVWRTEKINALHALYRSDLPNELMGAICNGKGVPDSHRSMYRRVAAMGRVSAFYAPAWSPDRSLSVVACASVTSMTHLSLASSVGAGVMHMDELLNATVLQAMDPEMENPLNSTLIGGPGAGKSYISDLVGEAALPGAFSAKDHSSKAADFVPNDRNFNTTHYADEATALMTNMTAKFQLSREEDMARLKTSLSNAQIAWDRYVPAENDNHREAEKQSIVAIRPRNKIANANKLRVDPDSDTAILDRIDTVFFTPFAENAIAPVERMTNANSSRRRDLWSKMVDWIRQEMALKAFWVILSRAQVFTVNMDVANLMLTESLRDAQKYIPSICTNMRSTGRATQSTSAILFRSAYYTLFHSESSPLANFMDERTLPATHSLRDLYSENPHYLHEMAELVGPYLWAQWDHGCWLITRLVKAAWPFNTYMILRLIAAMDCGFRRQTMAQVYRRGKVNLIDDDVAKRMEGRQEGMRNYPLFVQELLDRERHLDNGDLPCNDHGLPRFAQCTSGISESREFSSTSAPQSTYTDPNYIEIVGTLDQVAAHVIGYVRHLYIMETVQVASVLSFLQTKTLLVPIFNTVDRRAEYVEPSHLTFKTIEVTRNGRRTRKVVCEQRPAVLIVRNQRTGVPTVRILTGALMIPPHFMLMLLLTSAESKHTRPRVTTIPLEVEQHPELMHEWQIAPHPERTLSAVDHSVPIQSMTEMFASTHATIELVEGDASGEPMGIDLSTPQRVVDRDPEVAAYERHMRSLHQMPSYDWMLEQCERDPGMQVIVQEDRLSVPPGEYPTERQYEGMFQLWIYTKAARPGGAESKRDRYYDAMSHFHNSLSNSTSYPHADISDAKVQRHLQLATELGTINRTPKMPVLESMMKSAANEGERADLARTMSLLKGYAVNRSFVLALGHWLMLKRNYDAHTHGWLQSHRHKQARRAIEWLVFGGGEIVGPLHEPGNAPMDSDPMCLLEEDSGVWNAIRQHVGAFVCVSERWLDFLSDWYAYHRKTRRITLVLMTRDDLDVLGAHTMLPFNVWRTRERQLEAVRKRVKGKRLANQDLDVPETDFFRDYVPAKALVRTVRINYLDNTIQTYSALIALDNLDLSGKKKKAIREVPIRGSGADALAAQVENMAITANEDL